MVGPPVHGVVMERFKLQLVQLLEGIHDYAMHADPTTALLTPTLLTLESFRGRLAPFAGDQTLRTTWAPGSGVPAWSGCG